jgi:hypothetical protein
VRPVMVDEAFPSARVIAPSALIAVEPAPA